MTESWDILRGEGYEWKRAFLHRFQVGVGVQFVDRLGRQYCPLPRRCTPGRRSRTLLSVPTPRIRTLPETPGPFPDFVGWCLPKTPQKPVVAPCRVPNGNPTAPKRWKRNGQALWEERGTNTLSVDELQGSVEQPFYNLMMFPYPSAEGLHVGNIYAFTGADAHGRYQRLLGKTVFEPIGFDAFGIHSENYALKQNVPPDGS